MGTFTKAVNALARGLGLLGQMALAAMILTICYDVVMRYVFARPTEWSLEVNTFLVIFVCLIPAADVLLEDQQLRISFLAGRVSPKTRRFLESLCCLMGLVFCLVMAWKGGLMAWQAFAFNERMSTPLGTPLVIPYLFLPVGFGAMGLQYLVKLIRSWQGPSGRSSDRPAAGLEVRSEQI